MKYITVIFLLILIGCSKHATSYAPAGAPLSQQDLLDSRERTRKLNLLEKNQIEEWIKSQPNKFFPTNLNYWIDVQDLHANLRKENSTVISYQYDIYDFDMKKLYNTPVQNKNVMFGRFEELKPVEDALRYLDSGQEATLLIPSSLGYGAVGDGDRIITDMPLIVKLKVL